MNLSLSLTIAFVLLTTCTSFAEGVRITPQWISKNPGKLMLSSYTNFAGETAYLATLKFDKKAQYEVWTKIQFVGEDNHTSRWITTKCRAGAPADSIRFGDTSKGIYDSKTTVIYEVYEITPTIKFDGSAPWTQTLVYILDRSDWTELEIAARDQER